MVNGGFNGNPLRNEVEPAARKTLRTDQPTILAQAGHVPQAAAFQSFPVAPFRWENHLAFRGRGHRWFLRCKDLLPKNCDLSRFLPDCGSKILCNPLHNVVGIFCQTLPLTMKNKSQNAASGGRAAKGNFRQHEIRGPRCRRGRFFSNQFSIVRIYYLKNANYQGFCPDLPVKFCSILAISRRKFLPSWCRMKITGQSLYERRRKSGEPLPKSGMGFVASGGRGKFLAKFARAVRRFRPESRR